MWGFGPSIPPTGSPQWADSNDFSPRPPIQERNQPSAGASEVEESNQGTSDDESSSDSALYDGASRNQTSNHESMGYPKLDDEDFHSEGAAKERAQKASSDGTSSDDEAQGLRHQSEDSKDEQKEINEKLQKELRQDLSGDPESSTVPYFICVACETARPTRLEDTGICVYCFEHQTQYCIKGGHEDDKISFVDSDWRLHEVCNRCRSDPDPT
jgi:hypothetical protein